MKAGILGKPYTVNHIPAKYAGGQYLGTCDRDLQTISVVHELLGPEQEEEAILHEGIHIIDEELNIGLTEEQVGRLAVGLYSAGCRIKVEK